MISMLISIISNNIIAFMKVDKTKLFNILILIFECILIFSKYVRATYETYKRLY